MKSEELVEKKQVQKQCGKKKRSQSRHKLYHCIDKQCKTTPRRLYRLGHVAHKHPQMMQQALDQSKWLPLWK